MADAKKYPICVIVIARNEAENLKKSLASVADWVADIVVVINDCTDNTGEVARGFGARVFEHSWQGYRDQKNFALNLAEQSWVLNLDADEVVSAQLRQSITTFMESDDPAVTGAVFSRRTWFMGRWIKHGDWYPDRKLRLFRKGSGRFVGKAVHENIEIEGQTANLGGDLLHYSFPSIRHYHQKQLIYAKEVYRQQLRESKTWSGPQAVIRPLWRFLRAYFLRLGFLDGFAGFYIDGGGHQQHVTDVLQFYKEQAHGEKVRWWLDAAL